MVPDPGEGAIAPEQRKWFRLGIAMAVAWAAFTAILLGLLQVNPTLGLAFAVVGGTVGGVALTLFVLYVYR